MAAVTDRSFLENGDWRFYAVSDINIYPVCIDPAQAYDTDLWSRIFKYGKNQYAYNVSFSVRELSKTHIDQLRGLGAFAGMADTSQITLF